MWGIVYGTRDYKAGGHGVDPHGEHPHGAAKDLFSTPPVFVEGRPADGQTSVALDAFIKFGTFYAGSHGYLARMRVEISVDNGESYADVYVGDDVAAELGLSGGYQTGFTGRVFRRDGHSVFFIFRRLLDWPAGKTIYIRFSGQDGYGRAAVKTLDEVEEEPMEWFV